MYFQQKNGFEGLLLSELQILYVKNISTWIHGSGLIPVIRKNNKYQYLRLQCITHLWTYVRYTVHTCITTV